MNNNDGGSAFPEPHSAQCGGMTLRDYFAAKALPAVITAKAAENPDELVRRYGLGMSEIYAHEAYEIADALILVRGTP
jgi:hypothetical protein